MCFNYLGMSIFYLQRVKVVFHKVHHVASPCFHSSLEWTTQTLRPSRFFAFLCLQQPKYVFLKPGFYTWLLNLKPWTFRENLVSYNTPQDNSLRSGDPKGKRNTRSWISIQVLKKFKFNHLLNIQQRLLTGFGVQL